MAHYNEQLSHPGLIFSGKESILDIVFNVMDTVLIKEGSSSPLKDHMPGMVHHVPLILVNCKYPYCVE